MQAVGPVEAVSLGIAVSGNWNQNRSSRITIARQRTISQRFDTSCDFAADRFQKTFFGSPSGAGSSHSKLSATHPHFDEKEGVRRMDW